MVSEAVVLAWTERGGLLSSLVLFLPLLSLSPFLSAVGWHAVLPCTPGRSHSRFYRRPPRWSLLPWHESNPETGGMHEIYKHKIREKVRHMFFTVSVFVCVCIWESEIENNEQWRNNKWTYNMYNISLWWCTHHLLICLSHRITSLNVPEVLNPVPVPSPSAHSPSFPHFTPQKWFC